MTTENQAPEGGATLTDEQIDALWGRYDQGYDTRRALVERIRATLAARPTLDGGPTDAQILAAARALNKQCCDECGTDEEDSWKLYGNSYIIDAGLALRAAIAVHPKPLAGTPSRADYVKAARVYALAYGLHDDAPSYLPRTQADADVFEPHAWVIGAMMQAFGDGWADGHAAGVEFMKGARQAAHAPAEGTTVPLSAVRPIAVEAIRAVTGSPDVQGSAGRWLVDEMESVAKAAAIAAQPQAKCPGGNPACPCQDGDACHYRDAPDGTKAWPSPAEAHGDLTDEQIVAHLEAAGIKFQRFMGSITGTKDCWSTAGSQDVRKLAAGIRAIVAASKPQPKAHEDEPATIHEQALSEMDGVACPRCLGSGSLTAMSNGGPDAHEMDVDCHHCGGTGSARDAYLNLSEFYSKAQR